MDRWNIVGRLASLADLQEETSVGTSIIEIAGNKRVLIEYHKGICQYTPQIVGILVKFGCVQILGEDLEICRMTKDQLVVSGCIQQIRLDGSDLR